MIDAELLAQAQRKGTDADYRSWVQKQASCISGKWSEWVEELGEWRNPACHVRRANEFGTAYKADYACVPMTHAEHRIQSDKGEVEVLRRCLGFRPTPEQAKSWFDEQRIRFLRLWLAS